MYVMHDEIYETPDGRFYTKEYLKHNGGLSDVDEKLYWNHLWNGKDMIPLELATGPEVGYDSKTIITCNYDQLFTREDSLILCNNMVHRLYDTLELESGIDYDEEDDYYYDVYQYFIINDFLAEVLSKHTDEIIYYDSELEIYVLGVTHCGTSWDYVGATYKC